LKERKFSIGLYTAIAVVIASQIGTGVFTSIGFQVMDITSGFSIVLLWLLGGLVAISGAFSYGELSAAMPRSGGEYHLLSEIYHPIVGFASGWISVAVGYAAPIAAASMAMGDYASSVLVSLETISPQDKSLVSIAIAVSGVSMVTLVHFLKDTAVSAFQIFFTALKIILILILIVFGLAISDSVGISFSPNKQSFTEIISAPFAISLVFVMYSYSGWNTASYIVGELKNPGRNLPLSLFIGTLVVVLLYISLNAIFLYSTPINELAGQTEVGYIAAKHIFGHKGGVIMGILISVGLISAISSMVWAGPRVMQVMGEDTQILKPLAKKNKNGVPAISLVFQHIIVMIFIFSSTFENIITFIGFILTLSSLLTVVGVFIMRLRKPDMKRPYKTWGYPISPAFFIIVMVWMLFYVIKERPEQAFWGIITILAGLIVYFINKKVVSN